MVYRLMSQGVNTAVAKALLSMESKYDEAMANMEKNWQAKHDAITSSLQHEIQSLKVELAETKSSVRESKMECLDWKRLYLRKCSSTKQQASDVLTIEQIHDDMNTKIRSLNGTIKVILDRVVDHQSKIFLLQKNIKDFLQRYNDRNDAMDTLFSEKRTEIECILDAVEVVDHHNKILTQDFKIMKHAFYHNLDVMHTKVDECIVSMMSAKDGCCDETFVSIDEHNQLRSHLEDQILECSMKYDHVLLTVQQQYNETKRRCEELHDCRDVSMGNKLRLDYSPTGSQSNNLPCIQANDKAKQTNVDEIIGVDTQSIDLDFRKSSSHSERDRNLIDDASSAAFDDTFIDDSGNSDENEYLKLVQSAKEKVFCPENDEQKDDDSLFGSSVNLIFLSEMNIRD